MQRIQELCPLQCLNKMCFKVHLQFVSLDLSSLLFATRPQVSRKRSYFYENCTFRKTKVKKILTAIVTVTFTGIK